MSNTITAGAIINSVLRTYGVGLNGEQINTQETNDVMEDLNMLIKSIGVKGMKLWLRKNLVMPLVASQSAYTIGTTGGIVSSRPTEIVSAYRRDVNSTTDTPMTVFSREEYRSLADKVSEGPPLNLYFDAQLNNSEVNIWPTPTAADVLQYQVHLDYKKTIDDVTNVTDILEFPLSWHRAVKWNLAKEAMISFDLPEKTERLIRDMAKSSLREAEASDRMKNTSIYFKPERMSRRG